MSDTITLRFRARGTALVIDLTSMTGNHGTERRFIGRKHDPKLGRNGGWPATDEPHVFTYEVAKDVNGIYAEIAKEYLLHVRHGDLWPADEHTARFCGCAFDPYFGEPPPVEPEPATDEPVVEHFTSHDYAQHIAEVASPTEGKA